MQRLKTRWQSFWERRFFHWVDKRAPRATQVRLNRNNLYIFPNLTGALFLLVVTVIWALGTNYQNNLILALSYMLISLFVVAIYHTYANLAGIQLTFIQAQSGFAGDDIAFVLELRCAHKQGCNHLELRLRNGEAQTISLTYDQAQRTTLWVKSQQRGYLAPGRLLIHSRFPLGIIRCWTWVNLDASALVYPMPIPCEEPYTQTAYGHEEGGKITKGGDEFHGLREYQAGDPIKQIAWKQYAQEKGLLSKEYHQVTSAEKWLDWNSLTLPQEERLSGLCHWALIYEQEHKTYGLALPGIELSPARGEAHHTAVLTALAQYGLAPKRATTTSGE